MNKYINKSDDLEGLAAARIAVLAPLWLVFCIFVMTSS